MSGGLKLAVWQGQRAAARAAPQPWAAPAWRADFEASRRTGRTILSPGRRVRAGALRATHMAAAAFDGLARTAPRAASTGVVALLVEGAFALAVLCALAAGSVRAAQWYLTHLQPYVVAVPAPPAPRGVRTDDPVERHRWQEVLDGLGEASTYLNAKRPDWARTVVERVLKLDPQNQDALALLRRIEAEPPRVPSAAELAAQERERQLLDLLGAALTSLDRGDRALAGAYLSEAEQLAPDVPDVRAVRTRFDLWREPESTSA